MLMKKHFVYSIVFGILFILSFCFNNTLFAQGSNNNGGSQLGGGLSSGTLLNTYYPTNGPLQIIKKNGSYIYGENTKVIFSFDMSDEKTYGSVFQKFQISLSETSTTKKVFTGDFSIDANKVLSGLITGLTPNTNYTMFIKPYTKGAPKDVQMSVAVATTNNSTLIKSFFYTRNTNSIALNAIIEGVPTDSTTTFDIVATSGFLNKKDIPPTDTVNISPTTKQYSYIETNVPAGAYSVTVTLRLKNGATVTQTKTFPDTVVNTQTNNNSNNQQQTTKQSPDDYQFLTKLPGLNIASLCKEKDTSGKCLVYNFDEYLQALIKLTYSIIALIAVFQIIYYGLKTMLSVTPFGKADSKERIMNAIMGIVIALGSYLILYTINPKLVTIHLGAPKVDITTKNGTLFSIIGESQVKMYDTIGGVDFKRTSYYGQIKSFVANMNYAGHTDKIPHCLAQVAIQRESGGRPDVIGHDENVASADIGSRVTFINSGKKQSGATFTPNTNLITKTDLLNDDTGANIYTAKNPSANDLGLDWRFSHGVGLKQITFFPTGSTAGANWDKGAAYPITSTKTAYPKDMLDPNNAIQFGVEMLQLDYEMCGKDIIKTYKMYGIGSCDSTNTYVVKEAATRKKMYDQCLAQDN